jgi:hypothetical protein
METCGQQDVDGLYRGGSGKCTDYAGKLKRLFMAIPFIKKGIAMNSL